MGSIILIGTLFVNGHCRGLDDVQMRLLKLIHILFHAGSMADLGLVDVAFNTQVLVTVRGRTTLPVYSYSYLLLFECSSNRLFRTFILVLEDFGSVLYVLHLFDNNVLITVVIFCV